MYGIGAMHSDIRALIVPRQDVQVRQGLSLRTQSVEMLSQQRYSNLLHEFLICNARTVEKTKCYFTQKILHKINIARKRITIANYGLHNFSGIDDDCANDYECYQAEDYEKDPPIKSVICKANKCTCDDYYIREADKCVSAGT